METCCTRAASACSHRQDADPRTRRAACSPVRGVLFVACCGNDRNFGVLDTTLNAYIVHALAAAERCAFAP